jgi:hypothetical protein
MTMSRAFDEEAQRLGALFPKGPRLVVIGSTDFWHDDSERTCAHLGRLLASIHDLVLITGGVEGIGEGVGRSFFRARCAAEQEPRVYHVLPEGEETWDYGETFFAGSDMVERREILGRLAEVYLAIEGGPGTVHEAVVAAARKALVIPVGRSGGHAAVLYSQMTRPPAIDDKAWTALGASGSTPEETAAAAFCAVQSCLI